MTYCIIKGEKVEGGGRELLGVEGSFSISRTRNLVSIGGGYDHAFLRREKR